MAMGPQSFGPMGYKLPRAKALLGLYLSTITFSSARSVRHTFTEGAEVT